MQTTLTTAGDFNFGDGANLSVELSVELDFQEGEVLLISKRFEDIDFELAMVLREATDDVHVLDLSPEELEFGETALV